MDSGKGEPPEEDIEQTENDQPRREDESTVRRKAVLTLVVVLAATLVVTAGVVWIASDSKSGSETVTPPQTALDIVYDQTESVVVIRHDGGDPVDVKALSVRGEGMPQEEYQFSEFGLTGTFSEGESVEIPVTDGAYDISVVWDSQTTNARATLATNTGSTV